VYLTYKYLNLVGLYFLYNSNFHFFKKMGSKSKNMEINVLLLGDKQVGKTSLLVRWTEGKKNLKMMVQEILLH